MTVWDLYPPDYCARQVQFILRAIQAGECVSIVGLSGSGKSNLLGYLAQRGDSLGSIYPLRLVDCNRLPDFTPGAFFHQARHALDDDQPASDEWTALETVVGRFLSERSGLGLLLDRFDAMAEHAGPAFYSNLRALRDAHKYSLVYVAATRRPLQPHSELSELFYANTIWMGPLSESDARWSITRFAARKNLAWGEDTLQALLQVTRGYPSFLRAACEACADGAPLDPASLSKHPAVARRVEEFWSDHPGEADLRNSGLAGHPLLSATQTAAMPPIQAGDASLTAKESLLWGYLLDHPNQVCEKDNLIRAVWPEDRIYDQGIRDDSLAQLVRRLREKVEADPSVPQLILTIPGRGYRYLPPAN